MKKELSNVVIWAEGPKELKAIEEVLRQKKFAYDIFMDPPYAEVFESLSPSDWDKILDEIQQLDPERIVEWKKKFEERLKALVGNAGIDPVRVVQEASIIADRLDINEEITRFKSHNKLFLSTLELGANQGKKLTFILQEMGREANTLATKCQSAKIAALAIQLKDSVETIREQTMNIE